MQNKISVIIFLVIAACIGLVFAVDIGSANYEQLGIYAVIATIIYFFVHGWKNVWWLTALLSFSGVIFYQAFVINVDHLFVLMLGLASIMFLISRGSMHQAPEFARAGSAGASFVVFILLVFALLHFFTYYAIPYSPREYSVKTSSKAYFASFASMFCFFWVTSGPYGFTLKPNWQKTLIVIMIFSVTGNVIVRGVLFLMGFQAVDGLTDESVGLGSVFIPLVNMYPGTFALRVVSPLVCLILFMIATGRGWWAESKFSMKAFVLFGIGMCLLGAVFSGGRAVLPSCIVLILAASLMRRKINIIFLMTMAMVLLIALLNIFSDLINSKAPFYVARSVQVILLNKGETYETIGNSQEVRDLAAIQSLVEWRRDNRSFFFGRSVLRITADEAEYINDHFGKEGFVMNAMKSGRTHNMITDLLLQYGLVGCILYLAANFMVMRFVWKLRKNLSDEDGVTKSIADAMAIYTPFIFVYFTLSGNFMPIVIPLMIGLIRSHLVTLKRREPLPRPAEVPALPIRA